MTYVTERNKMGRNQGKELDKGFGIDNESKKRAVATDYTIDTNRRPNGEGKVNKNEPRMTD